MPEHPLIQKYRNFWGIPTHLPDFLDVPPSAVIHQLLVDTARDLQGASDVRFDWDFRGAELALSGIRPESCRAMGCSWNAAYLLTFEHALTGERKTLCATKVPLPVPHTGVFLLASGAGTLVERRPISRLRIRLERRGARKELKNLVADVGLHPTWSVVEDFVDQLQARIVSGFLRARRLLPGSGRSLGPVSQILILARAMDVAVQSAFRDQGLLPLADTTNPLAAASQSRAISLAGARVHKPFLLGATPSDPVRYLRPVQRHVFCPVETPESKSIGLSLHFSANSSPDLWNPDAVQAGEDQGSPKILDDLDQNRFLGHGAGLIPFLQHTDPTRAMMGAKNMKQAVAVVDAQSPLVTTGHEDQVYASGSEPGTNVLVGYLPWYGYNYEDGIVISRSLANRLASRRTHVLGPFFCKGNELGANKNLAFPLLDETGVITEGCEVAPGDVLAAWRPIRWVDQGAGRNPRWSVIQMDPPRVEHVPVGVHGRVVRVDQHYWKVDERPYSWLENRARLTVHVQETMPLTVGDKIMGRHGNKGVVSRIQADREMPFFLDPLHGTADHPGTPDYHGEDRPHTHLEMILNPLGVIGRMNFGQLLETHVGLLMRRLGGADRRYVDWGRPFRDDLDFGMLANDLQSIGIVDGSGKARLHWHMDGQHIQAEHPSLVGVQYLFKLNHLAQDKMNVRGRKGPLGLLTGQPVAGKKRSGGMKLGEMEMWCLRERPVPHVLAELFAQGDPDKLALKTFRDVLFVLGFQFQTGPDPSYVFRFLDAGSRIKSLRAFLPLSDHTLPRLNPKAPAPALHPPKTEGLYDSAIFGEQAKLLFASSGRGRMLDHTDQWGRIDLNVPIWHPLIEQDGLLPTQEQTLQSLAVLPVRYRGFLWDGRTPPRPGRLDVLYAEIIRRNARIQAPDKVHEALDALEKACQDVILPLMSLADRDRFQERLRKLVFPDHSSHWSKALRDCESVLREEDLEDEADLLLEICGKSRRELEQVRALSSSVHNLFSVFIAMLGGVGAKKGLIRNNILGLRLNRSARGVIVPEPGLPMGTIGLPESWKKTLFPDQSEEPWTVLLNRPPSLLPCSVQAFSVRFEKNSGVIRINPGICASLGADFDGDQVSVFALSEPKAVAEARQWLRPGAMPFSPKESGESPLLSDNLDIRLGMYRLAQDRESFEAASAVFGNRVLWDEDAPWNHRLDALLRGMAEHFRDAMPRERERAAAAWLRLCFTAATQSGISFSFLDMLKLLPATDSPQNNALREIPADQVADLNAEAERIVDQMLSGQPENPVSLLYRSKAASKKEQLAQSLVRRGALRLPHLQNRAWLISTGYVRGLRPDEFFSAAFATREAMMFKKLRTAAGGGFTRRLVECCQEMDGRMFQTSDPTFCLRDAIALHEPFTRMDNPPLGLLAAHVIGEAATQASMKVFHTGKAGAAASIPDELFNALSDLSHAWETGPDAPEDPVLAALLADLRKRIAGNPLYCVAAQALLEQKIQLRDCGRFQDEPHPLSSLIYSLTWTKLKAMTGLTQNAPYPCNAKERFVLRFFDQCA